MKTKRGWVPHRQVKCLWVWLGCVKGPGLVFHSSLDSNWDGMKGRLALQHPTGVNLGGCSGLLLGLCLVLLLMASPQLQAPLKWPFPFKAILAWVWGQLHSQSGVVQPFTKAWLWDGTTHTHDLIHKPLGLGASDIFTVAQAEAAEALKTTAF